MTDQEWFWGVIRKSTAAAVLALAAVQTASAAPIRLEAGEAPSTTLELVLTAFRSARESIQLNIYEFSSSDISDVLLERIRAGVRVEILEEGQPVGGISAAGRGIQAQLAQAMRYTHQGNHFYEMTSRVDTAGPLAKRRYRFDHGKYAIIDGKSLLIGSENFSPTGHPQAGTKGNRGWETWIHDRGIAREYAETFAADTDMSAGDLIDLTQDDSLHLWRKPPRGRPAGSSVAEEGFPPLELDAPFAPWSRPQRVEAESVESILSPETSLDGLVGLIDSAERSIDIQQMTFAATWKQGDRVKPSPLYQAVKRAARRGVKVRVLLNDEKVFQHPGAPTAASKNLPTIDGLNELARSEGLDVEGRTANLRRMGVTYIHNKGMLVDGNKTLVSSINWDSNSVLNNRETAVVITSESVFEHYHTLFDGDWKLSRAREPRVLATDTLVSRDHPAAQQRRPSAHREVTSEICPERLRVQMVVGELHPSDEDDRSFDRLSGSQFTADFVRSPGGHACLLMDTRSGRLSGKRRFIQIRKRPDGNRSVMLEGYTSNGSVYSIRTIFGPEGPYDGEYDAKVYDGSGPSRSRMGDAVMTVETRIE